MTLRKRISGSRDERRKARETRREERRRAEQAKRAAQAARTSDGGAKPKRSGASPARTKASAKPASGRTGKRRAAPSKAIGGEIRKVSGGAVAVGAELAKLGREVVAIPVQLWLTAAESVGGVVLRAWRRAVRPLLIMLWRAARRVVRFGERHVTPARGVFVVCLGAIAALVASQWQDYHSVSVGIDAYAGDVGAIAPAPEIERDVAGTAHSWVMIPLASAALVAIVVAVTWRRRVATLLVPIGIAVIAIALIVDLPKGLDEGAAAVAYEGAKASLLQGFWLQLACAAVLIVGGLLLPAYLRPASAHAPTGPSLIDRSIALVRRHARRPPSLKGLRRRRLPRPRAKRKVQGAGT